MYIRRLLIPVLVALLLASCTGEEKPDLQEFITAVRSRPSPPIKPIADIGTHQATVRMTNNKRNPFAFTAATTTAPTPAHNIRPGSNHSLAPLENFRLELLRMVGTLTVGDVRHALILAPDGIVYRPTIGDHIGEHHGAITAITDSATTVLEIVADGRGGFTKQSTSIPYGQ